MTDDEWAHDEARTLKARSIKNGLLKMVSNYLVSDYFLTTCKCFSRFLFSFRTWWVISCPFTLITSINIPGFGAEPQLELKLLYVRFVTRNRVVVFYFWLCKINYILSVSHLNDFETERNKYLETLQQNEALQQCVVSKIFKTLSSIIFNKFFRKAISNPCITTF